MSATVVLPAILRDRDTQRNKTPPKLGAEFNLLSIVDLMSTRALCPLATGVGVPLRDIAFRGDSLDTLVGRLDPTVINTVRWAERREVYVSDPETVLVWIQKNRWGGVVHDLLSVLVSNELMPGARLPLAAQAANMSQGVWIHLITRMIGATASDIEASDTPLSDSTEIRAPNISLSEWVLPLIADVVALAAALPSPPDAQNIREYRRGVFATTAWMAPQQRNGPLIPYDRGLAYQQSGMSPRESFRAEFDPTTPPPTLETLRTLAALNT